MQGTRIEILKDGKWLTLILSDNTEIRYNAVINRIGRVDSREISHTNTFSLAPVWHNTNVLGLNVFNPLQLAKALNAKYEAKYYVEDKILQKGFLVINNTNDGEVKVNFIDESLQITEEWGTTTYREMLRNSTLPFPVDYQEAINELFEYDMDKTEVLVPTNEVGTRGYHLCLFPNNLNAIGDKFQLDENENRIDNAFNPYQSRPIFNARSLFDLATVAYGYTPIFDPSVDWDRVSRTYMVDKGLLESAKGNNGIQQITYPTVSNAGVPYYRRSPDFLCEIACFYTRGHLFDFPASVSKTPGEIPNFSTPLLFETWTGPPFNEPPSQPWLNENVIFTPNVAAGNVGTINFKATTFTSSTGGDFTSIYFIGIWKNITPGQPTVDEVVADYLLGATSTPLLVEEEPTTSTGFNFTLDKSIFDTVPSGADPDGLIGVSMIIHKGLLTSPTFNMGSMIVTETYLPEGVIAYDDYGQYLPDIVDLTHAAPNETIKSLLSGIMHKEGILLSINNNTREIKFFTYGAYEQQKFDGNFSDWSKYLQRYNPFRHNTNYGNNYAVLNRIGLNSPYQGNTYDLVLQNQGEKSKYKDFATNYLQKFKDIQNVKEVINSITPYLEFENKGLGLVEYVGTLGQLSQQRANGTIQGDFTGLYAIENVNGADLPNGVKEWYKLIDEAVKVDSEFLLPTEVIRTLDLSEPIFIEELGGWYIIEEVEAYVNSSRTVTVKVIKLIDDLRGLGSGPDTGEPDPDPIITLSSSIQYPNGFTTFNYAIINNVNFLNYIPTSPSSIKAVQLSDSPGNGGTPTGFEFNQTLNLLPYTNNTSVINGALPLGVQEGWYEVQVTDGDDPNLKSNIELVYLGDNTPPPEPVANIFVPNESPLVADGKADILWGYNYFPSTPTYVTLEWQKRDFFTGAALGPLRSLSLPATPTSGGATITQHDFVDGVGWYKIQLRTNIVDSSGQALVGEFWSII